MVRADERGQLAFAPDDGQAGGSHRMGRDVRGCSRRPADRRGRRDRGAFLAAAGGHLRVPDRLVQVRRLRQRGDAQLALEDGDPGPVLADGTGPVAGPCEQGHQLASSRFVERIEVEPARRGGDGAGHVPVGLGRRREPLEHVPHQSLDGDRARRPPIVEVRAVAEREPGQEWAARQRGRPAQPRVVARGGGGLQIGEIDVDAVGVEGDGRSVRDDPPTVEGRTQHGQRAPEGAPRGFVVRLGPQHRGQLVPGVETAFDPQQDQDRDRLAGVDDERRSIDPDVDGSQDADLEAP